MLPLTAVNSSVPVYCKRGTHLANDVRLALRPPMPSRLHTAGTSAFQPPVSSGQYLVYSLLSPESDASGFDSYSFTILPQVRDICHEN